MKYFKRKNSKRVSRAAVKVIVFFWIFIHTVHAQDVVARHGMVASAHPLASQAGLEILKQGGNAVDAMVATAFALGVVEPNASGIGGGGFMTIKMAGQSEGVTIDFRESAPIEATAETYYHDEESFGKLTHSGPKSIGVPGVPAGLGLVLKKYGTMNLAQVLKPAIRYAQEGFIVSEKLAALIIEKYDIISENPATAAIYLQDGIPVSAGGEIKNPDLAKTYKKLADKGVECFYRGAIAEAIVKEVRDRGGLLSLTDLKNYRAIEKKPILGSYKNYRILSSAPPSGGGTHLVELLNILKGYDLKKLKHNSVAYIHLLAAAMRICLSDKASNMADPAFYSVPTKKLTSQAYADGLRKYINPKKASFNYKASQMLIRESNSTTHISVIDKDGNMTALTQSINHWFGSGITVKGTGILLNNHLADFSSKEGQPNSIEPGKRPVSSIAPTLVLKGNQPYLTIGTPGGSRIIGALAQVFLNIVDFGMDVDAAIEAPRIHAFKKILHVEGRIPESVITGLEQLGHTVKKHKDYDNYFGGAQGVLVDVKKHELHGGADSRRDGVAAGY